jgi:RNA polymerase-binding transcription factor DksA
LKKEAKVCLRKRTHSQPSGKIIRDLKNALFRVENKTYGVCRVTGKLISKERLKIVPHATMSIEAKNQQR